ncbi:MAG: hypothetical protein Q7J47_03240 [Azoarcus sp.]|nr:hypothetical protein [Azoarcus sp.]
MQTSAHPTPLQADRALFIGTTNEADYGFASTSFRYNPEAPTVLLIAPQGCGKSIQANAFAKVLGCTHVIEGETLNGFDVDNPADIPRAGALVITTERDWGGKADLIIEARTKAGFDRAVALLSSAA